MNQAESHSYAFFPRYSRAERIADGIIHLLGLTFGLAACVSLALAALPSHDALLWLALGLYGLGLMAMLGCSAAYNMIQHPRIKAVIRRLDHAAIFVMIAGTYTPFTLLSGHGAALLAGLWGAALAGSGLKLIDPVRFRRIGLVLYLGMGWVGMIAGWAVFAQMSAPVLALIVAGGLLYTVGVGFYLAERMHFHNTIWHVFVLVATIAFFAAVTQHVADTAALAAVATLPATP